MKLGEDQNNFSLSGEFSVEEKFSRAFALVEEKIYLHGDNKRENVNLRFLRWQIFVTSLRFTRLV